jgi:hypothetical protein
MEGHWKKKRKIFNRPHLMELLCGVAGEGQQQIYFAELKQFR